MRTNKMFTCIKTCFFFALTTISSPYLMAQNGNVLKKYIKRTLNINTPSYDSGPKLIVHYNDSSICDMLIKEVLAGNISVYKDSDEHFEHPILRGEFIKMTTTHPDIDDLSDGTDTTFHSYPRLKLVLNHRVHFEHYTILEEWSFDKAKGSTNVAVKGYALSREVYSEQGAFLGIEPVFWFRYDDVKFILKRYEDLHLKENVSLAIWNDYFSEVKK